MKVDGGVGGDLSGVAKAAEVAEEAGYDGIWSAEAGHDPFLPLLLAAEHTSRVQLGTAIAVAFARNPVTLAALSNDVHAYSGGRFVLGLGSQVRAHIQKRYSMPWSHPAARMREMILAIHAVWDAWASGGKLDFRGEFYTHTLMTPFFSPGPNPHGKPKVFLAAVGPRMTEVAGEVADGLLAHGFTTERYLKEQTLPALEEGFRRGGRSSGAFEITMPVFVVMGTDDKSLNRAATAVKAQIAFYASTPAYRPVLELHGWGDLQGDLNRLSKRGEWAQMGTLVDDEMLDAFAVSGSPDEIPGRIVGRFGGVVDRITFYAPYGVEPGTWEAIGSRIRSLA